MKKRIGSIVVSLAVLAMVAGCGGSSSSTTTTTTTPTATSAKTANVNAKLMNSGWNMYFQIFNALNPGAQIIKVTTNYTASCSGTYNAYSCTINDGSGGSCTATGSFSNNDTVFTATLSCDNFYIDSDTVADGSMQIDITVNPDYMAMVADTSDTTKASTLNKTTADSCTIEDDDTVFGENNICEYTENTCSDAAAFLTFKYTVGPEGFRVTDECGIYEFAAGYVMDAYWCKHPSVEIYDMTFNMIGTFNNELTNLTETITCDFTNI